MRWSFQLQAVRTHASANDEARTCAESVERNRERMRDPEFRAAGLCTSTGVVEAGCQVAIGTRGQRAGMHWTVVGVDAIIALRCAQLSRRFEDFWERRAEASRPSRVRPATSNAGAAALATSQS